VAGFEGRFLFDPSPVDSFNIFILTPTLDPTLEPETQSPETQTPE